MRKSKLTENISLKIMSVIVGILVWLIVVNVDNPTTRRSLTIQGDNVELLNTAYVDSANKMCIQDDDPDPVRVTLTGSRKVLSQISSSDITLTADLQQAGSLETDPVMVPISASCTNVSPTDIEVTPQYLSVHLEDKATQEFLVNVTYGETRPGKGYEVGTQTANPEKIKITGPKSLINKIDTVTANVGVDNKTQDFTEEANLIIRDKNQDILNSRMAYLTIDTSKVSVTTKLWKVQSGIRLKADYIGEPAEGYQVESVTTVPETVSIAGTDEALELLRGNSNTLWIDSDEVDINEKSSDMEVKVSLRDVIPENMKLTTGTSEDVIVRVAILPEGSHAYNIPTSDIQTENTGENLQMAFGTDSVEIRVQAADGDLDDFDISKVKVSVDLDGMTEGSYQVPVTVKLPSGYELLGDVTADITISEISNAEENGE